MPESKRRIWLTTIWLACWMAAGFATVRASALDDAGPSGPSATLAGNAGTSLGEAVPPSRAPVLGTPAAKATPVVVEAVDGLAVSADLYTTVAGKSAPLILLFHQAGSNSGEYEPIAPRLVTLGFNCLALNQRSGGTKWGRNNPTVMALGASTDFNSAYADLEGALLWARREGFTGPLIAWGSSYTAALVFRLAAEHREVAGVLSFSPGEYLGPGEPVKRWARAVRVPVFITSGGGPEVAPAQAIADAVGGDQTTHYVPHTGVHGSSTLRTDRNPGGTEENWQAVEAFLARYLH